MRHQLGLFAVLATVGATARCGGPSVALPPVEGVESVCIDAMAKAAADFSWAQPNDERPAVHPAPATVPLGELSLHDGEIVRVAGVLHLDFEWVGLYRSRESLEARPWRAPWVELGSVWPAEPYWRTRGPALSDRCAVVEGTYVDGAAGHLGMFFGAIKNVRRIDVWSKPYRPFELRMGPPPPSRGAPVFRSL